METKELREILQKKSDEKNSVASEYLNLREKFEEYKSDYFNQRALKAKLNTVRTTATAIQSEMAMQPEFKEFTTQLIEKEAELNTVRDAYEIEILCAKLTIANTLTPSTKD